MASFVAEIDIGETKRLPRGVLLQVEHVRRRPGRVRVSITEQEAPAGNLAGRAKVTLSRLFAAFQQRES